MKHCFNIIILMILSFSSCVREDYPKEGTCDNDNYIVVKSFDAENNDIAGTGAVKEVIIYVFDNNKRYIGSVSGYENTRILLPYKNRTSVTVVAWGNSQNNDQITRIIPDMLIKDALVILNTNEAYSNRTHVNSPNDLFWGIKNVFLSYGNGIIDTIGVKRKTASINIIARNLQKWAGITTEEIFFRVNETTVSTNFNGELPGAKGSYRVDATLNDNHEFTTDIFRTFPSETSPITIDIFKGDELIYTIDKDSNDNPMFLKEGRLLNVTIEFGRKVDVSVEIVEWNENNIDQNF